MKLLHAFIFVLFLLPTFAAAQSRAMERADRLFEETAYPDATEAYLKIVRDQPRNKKAMVRLADCYRLTNDPRNAMRWYARAVKFKGIRPEVWYHYGQVLMINRKYKEALPWFEKYRAAHPEDPRSHEMIEACLNQDRFAGAARLYAIKRLSVNSEASDFGPAFYKNSVVFASARTRQLFDKKYKRTGQGFLDLYVAAYEGKPRLGETELFRGKVNSPYHEATPSFSPDGKEMFFTRNNYHKGKMGASSAGVVNLATYRSVYAEGKWQPETPLPFNSPEYSVGHPCLHPDGKRLYFVSNMPGGEGGTDLYYVDRDGESWGEPVNLGPGINTSGNEMFPTLHPDGRLFFSCDVRPGLGGMDIYFVDLEAGENLVVENAGAPINSSGDDFAMIYDAGKGIGFLTSNRRGGRGDDDIYAFVKLIPLIGTVRDDAGNPLSGVTVSVLTGRSVVRLGTDEEGKFAYGLSSGQKLRIVFDKPGYQKTEREVIANELDRDKDNLIGVEMQAEPEGEK
jgi:hypothetical protein